MSIYKRPLKKSFRKSSLLESWSEDENCYSDDCDREDWELDEEHINLYGGDPTYCPECHKRLSYGDGYPHCLNHECSRYSPIDFDESIEVGKKVSVKADKAIGKVIKNAGDNTDINTVKLDKSGKVVEYSDSDLDVLDEDLDIEINASELVNNGFTTEMINLINATWDVIKSYKNALVDVDAYNVSEADNIKSIVNNIIETATNNIGKLQAIVDSLTNNQEVIADIDAGVEDAEAELKTADDELDDVELPADDDLDSLDEAFFHELLNGKGVIKDED